MIDQYTYELLKRLHEFPCDWNKNELEYGGFEAKYHPIYGYGNELGKLYSKLKSLGYLDIPKHEMKIEILFTQKSFDAVEEYETAMHKNNQLSLVEEENIRLQNQQLHYQNKIKDKEIEIIDLTKQNLILQNKQLRNKFIYSIIGVIVGFILSNWKDILIMLQIIDKP
jgi:hypothetical protein